MKYNSKRTSTTFPNTLYKYLPTTFREITIINNLPKEINSWWYSGILTNYCKKADHICIPLSYLCNQSFSEDACSEWLKYSKVKRLYKGVKSCIPNHMSISLMTVFYTVFERVTQTRIIEFLNASTHTKQPVFSKCLETERSQYNFKDMVMCLQK